MEFLTVLILVFLAVLRVQVKPQIAYVRKYKIFSFRLPSVSDPKVMSSIGTLYTTPVYHKGHRVRSSVILPNCPKDLHQDQILAVAALGGLKIDLAQNYKHHEDNEKPEYLAKFTSGKIPAFEGKDGFMLFESSAIARYGESHVYRMHFRDELSYQVIPVLISVSRSSVTPLNCFSGRDA